MSTVTSFILGNVTLSTAFSNSSLQNATSAPASHAYVTGSLQMFAVVGGALNSLFAIVLNAVILFSILTDQTLRSTNFFWNVISLSIANLLAGVTVVPFSTNIYHRGQWLHGRDVCKAFILSDYTQLPLAATILICTLINRFAELVTSPTTSFWYAISKSHRIRYILIAVPWLFAAICVPVILAGEKTESVRRQDNVCFFVLKDEFSIPSLVTMFAGPLFLLLITAILATTIYVVRIRNLPEGHALRESMPSAVAMSLVYGLSWMPFACIILRSYTCHCSVAPPLFVSTIVLTCASPFLSALAAFLHPDLRKRVKELAVNAWRWLTGFFGEDGKIVVKWTSRDPKLIKEDESVPSEF